MQQKTKFDISFKDALMGAFLGKSSLPNVKLEIEKVIAKIDQYNLFIEKTLSTYKNLLENKLEIDPDQVFSLLMPNSKYPELVIPEDLEPEPEPYREEFFANIQPITMLSSIFFNGKIKYAQEIKKAEQRYKDILQYWIEDEAQKKEKIMKMRLDYLEAKSKFENEVIQTRNEVDAFKHKYLSGNPEAISKFNKIILEPSGLSSNINCAYIAESKQLIVDYQLPNVDAIPSAKEYSYSKSKNKLIEKPRKKDEISELYRNLVASITLRVIYEIFFANKLLLEAICFNGFIETIDPATGKTIKPYLISLRTTRECFGALDILRVNKIACLKSLSARISSRPEEARPVRPFVEYNMIDNRFVDQTDILSVLDSSPNLMDMTPFEFEQLVSNLFTQKGLETRLTRSTKDGGIDCVAFDLRPILGGKIVIQAKRYTNTVGVSAVRDLYGSMMNEGANKGILVTTSGYGPDAFEFSKDKPIELIDGSGLLYLLKEVGIEAKIVFNR